MASGVRYKYDDGELRLVMREIARLPKDLRTDPNNDLRDAAGNLAEAIKSRMFAMWSASGTRQDDLQKSRTRVARDRKPSVRIKGGYHTSSDGRSVPYPLLLWGSEFGNYGSVLTFTRGRNATGYSIYPAVRQVRQSKALDEYEDAIRAILKNRGLR